MKKNTIRIVGFLFAAACVALLASCKNSTSPAKKDDGKKPTTPAAPAFDKAQLKGTWRYDITSGVYLFNFDDSATLRVAYGTDLTQANIKTRAAKVDYEVKGGNANSGTITIKFGDVKLESPFSLNDNVLTITNFKGNVVNLKKVTKEADVNVLKTVKFNEDKNKDDVVTNFNQNILGLGLVMPKSEAYKIVKLNNNEPGEKKNSTNKKVYHVAFSNNANKLYLTVDQDTGKKKTTEKDYSTTLTNPDLGKVEMKITISDLGLSTPTAFTVTRDNDGIKTITIGKTILERDAGQYDTVTGSTYTANDGDVRAAITKFAEKEE